MIDVHAHILPGMDDGSPTEAESLAMLRTAWAQGVREVFCTSHSWGISRRSTEYWRRLRKLREAAAEEVPGMQLHPGCEIACSAGNVWEVIGQLAQGLIFPMGNGERLLVEFWPDAPAEEIVDCLRLLQERTGKGLILAHVERCDKLRNAPEALDTLQSMGVLLQLNVFSLAEEKNPGIRDFARTLLAQERIALLGSDAHRMDHRPPCVAAGLAYIREHCRPEYAQRVCSGNAERLLLGR